MHVPHSPLGIALLILLVNLPFGYWRAGTRSLSVWWFVAIHTPVVLAIAFRFMLEIPFHWSTLPLYVTAFAVGQAMGGVLRRAHQTVPHGPTSK